MTSNTLTSRAVREAFVSSLQACETDQAIKAARNLLQQDSGIRQWSFIRNELKRVPKGKLALKPLKIALLSSFSIEFLHPPLVAYGLSNGLDIDIYQAGFGQFRQDLLNPESGLYTFRPDVLILAVEGKDWIPSLYRGHLDDFEAGLGPAIAGAQHEILSLIHTFRRKSEAAVLMHNVTGSVWPRLGILDWQIREGQSAAIYKFNECLAALCRETPGTYVVDYAGLVGRFGALNWYDECMSHYAGAPIAQQMLRHLAAEYMKFLRGLTGQTKKCLVLDLDNTLWGGVLGEDGLAGVQLGPTYPGSAFVAFQSEILNLHKRGVLLAIASKNNLVDVEEIFSAHPHMVLKKANFSSLQIHWKPKSESLPEIARHLGIGLEHMVLVDDNPVECEEVSSALPMVTTLCLPKRPEQFVPALLSEGLFDGLSLSAEDRQRGELYRQRDEAELLRAQSSSLEEFYQSLQMEVQFTPLQKATLARAAQLTQKTNQFNVTTFRYTVADLCARMADGNWSLTTVKVCDRFGDNGTVGLILAHVESGALDIDTFLLSCRVIGRSVETAMLAHLCEEAGRRGLREIRGRVIPTAKNGPAQDLFHKHGFEELGSGGSGETFWSFDLSRDRIPWPEWMKVVREAPAW